MCHISEVSCKWSLFLLVHLWQLKNFQDVFSFMGFLLNRSRSVSVFPTFHWIWTFSKWPWMLSLLSAQTFVQCWSASFGFYSRFTTPEVLLMNQFLTFLFSLWPHPFCAPEISFFPLEIKNLTFCPRSDVWKGNTGKHIFHRTEPHNSYEKAG